MEKFKNQNVDLKMHDYAKRTKKGRREQAGNEINRTERG